MVYLFAFVAILLASSPVLPHSGDRAGTASTRDSNWVPVQSSRRPEITVEKILKDVVGKEVTAQDAAGQSQPMAWQFEANEPKNAQILETQENDTSIAVVIQMSTGGAPGSDDAHVQLTGKLMLHYEWGGQDWVLRRIQNMNFRYTRGMLI